VHLPTPFYFDIKCKLLKGSFEQFSVQNMHSSITALVTFVIIGVIYLAYLLSIRLFKYELIEVNISQIFGLKREEDNDMLLNILDVVKYEDKKSRNYSKMSQKKKVINFHVQSNEFQNHEVSKKHVKTVGHKNHINFEPLSKSSKDEMAKNKKSTKETHINYAPVFEKLKNIAIHSKTIHNSPVFKSVL